MVLALLFGSYYAAWVYFLRCVIHVFTFLSLLVSVDRLLNVLKYCFIRGRAKLTGHLPQHNWNFKPLPEDPHEFPQVAIQLPMFNERAVCQAVIDCCCEMDWPAERLHVQVLDDSTDKVTRELVDEKVAEWTERGINIKCLRRTNRQGYKAGAMKEGMEILGAAGYKYVAVFDADFKPEPDFMLRTIPYLEGNPSVGYVQTRWVFTNPDESYLTKAQEVSLNYHMKCEQYTHSATGSFFNFNGTAGVWRRACIESAGGWNSRTTVEDMDLSLRAYLKGWKAIFLEDVTCLNELPASFFAYRKQQHRWTCGPVQLMTRGTRDIARSRLPPPRRMELLTLYFGVRKFATHFVALGFFCTVVPLAVLTPEVAIPTWVLVHLPIAVTISTAFFTPRGWVYSILYVLFENAMGIVKLWAVITGILDLKRAQEWVVTTKLGSSDKRPGTSSAPTMVPSCKMYAAELIMSAFLLTSGFAGIFSGRSLGISTYLLIQGLVFGSFGLNMVDAGGLLGGRLDTPLVRFRKEKKRTSARSTRRTQTIPVIKMVTENGVELAHEGMAAKSAPIMPSDAEAAVAAIAKEKKDRKPRSGLDRVDTGGSVGIIDAIPRSLGSSSPTTASVSGGDSESDNSLPSASSLGYSPNGSVTPSDSTMDCKSSAVVTLDKKKWPSPASSLANIYSPVSKNLKGKMMATSTVSRRGWRLVPFAGGGYASDHDD